MVVVVVDKVFVAAGKILAISICHYQKASEV